MSKNGPLPDEYKDLTVTQAIHTLLSECSLSLDSVAVQMNVYVPCGKDMRVVRIIITGNSCMAILISMLPCLPSSR